MNSPDPIRILLTGYADIQAVIDAINLGQVFRYCTKPWSPDQTSSIRHHQRKRISCTSLECKTKS